MPLSDKLMAQRPNTTIASPMIDGNMRFRMMFAILYSFLCRIGVILHPPTGNTEYGVLLHRPNRVSPYCFGGYVDFARP